MRLSAAVEQTSRQCPQGGMVRHSEVEAQQLQNGADQPFGLAQGQAEHGTQRQGGCDRQVRVLRLAAPVSACLGALPLDRFGREPHREAAAGAQAGVILSPVGELLALLGDSVPAIGVGFERHGGIPHCSRARLYAGVSSSFTPSTRQVARGLYRVPDQGRRTPCRTKPSCPL
jgi:hypothetical protein